MDYKNKKIHIIESNIKTESKQIEEKIDREEKVYYDFKYFEISENILITYIYILSSVLMNIMNRVIFNKMNFKFNFTYMLIQQSFSLFFFAVVCQRIPKFKIKLGEVSLKEFLHLKKHILIFSSIFVLNIMTSFIGQQKTNTAMFLILRKFVPTMTFLYDKLFLHKEMPDYFNKVILINLIGTILTGYNDLTSDTLGYFIVFLNNIFSLMYGKYTETFNKETGYPVVKLIIYNCYFSIPVCLLFIIFTGEYTRLMEFEGFSLSLFIAIMIGNICIVILNTSFVVSNSKNSSLFTQLLSNCKVRKIEIF
jgi:drug/metabolite transporter (DMT)-like permease